MTEFRRLVVVGMVALLLGTSVLAPVSSYHTGTTGAIDGFEDGTIEDIWDIHLDAGADARIVDNPVRHGTKALELESGCDSSNAEVHHVFEDPIQDGSTFSMWIQAVQFHGFGAQGTLMLLEPDAERGAKFKMRSGGFQYRIDEPGFTVKDTFGNWDIGEWYHMSVTLYPSTDTMVFRADSIDGFIGQRTVTDVPTTYTKLVLFSNPGDQNDTCNEIFVFDDVAYTGDPVPRIQELRPSDPEDGDVFGSGVALDGDTAVIGDRGEDAAYVFEWDGSSWVQQAKLQGEDTQAGDRFGVGVDLEGDTAVVGAHRHDGVGQWSGAAYVFVRTDGNWKQQAKLQSSDIEAGDLFGHSVALSGDKLLVSAHQDLRLGEDPGAVYVFDRDESTWEQQTKLQPHDVEGKDRFGAPIEWDGHTAVVGAHDKNERAGAAYVFVWDGASWSEQAKLLSSDIEPGDEFGLGIGLDRDTAVISAAEEDDPGTSSGAAYVFERTGSTWEETAKLEPEDLQDGDKFGGDPAVENGIVLIGAGLEDDPGTDSGATYLFEKDGLSWVQKAKIEPADLSGPDHFGGPKALDQGRVLIAAVKHTHDGIQSGAVYALGGIPDGSPTLPRHLEVHPGPDIRNASLAWDPPASNGSSDLTSYRINRSTDGGPWTQIAEVPADTTTYTDTGLACDVGYSYRVTAVNEDGLESKPSNTAPLQPHSLTHLLCRLNERYPFYWGDTIPRRPLLNNSNGGPFAPPTSLAEIDEHDDTEGEFPIWYEQMPHRFKCCSTLFFDRNALEADPGEVTLPLEDEIDERLPEGLADAITEILGLGAIDATYRGFRFQEKPFNATDLADQSAVVAHTGVNVTLVKPDFDGGAGGFAEGRLVLNATSNQLDLVGPERFWATADFAGPGIANRTGMDWAVEAPWDQNKALFRVSANLTYRAEPQLNGMLGAGIKQHPIRATFFAGGAGAHTDADAQLRGNVTAISVARANFSAGVEGAVDIKGEAVMPLAGLAAGEPLRSPYTHVLYEDLEGPALTLLLGPVTGSVEPIFANVTLCDPILDFCWTDEVRIDPPEDLDWEGTALTFGEATIVAHSAVKLNGTDADPASKIKVPPGTQDLLVEVNGTADTLHNVTFERPVGFYFPNGTYQVRTWNVTVPDVDVGPDGKTLLHLDTLEVQKDVQTLTRDQNRTFDEAVHATNQDLDTNGDGEADLGQDVVGFDDRTPTKVQAAIEGLDAGGSVFVGEETRVNVTVRDAVSDGPVSEGSVSVLVNGTEATNGPISTEGVQFSFVVEGVDEGPADVEVRYEGTSSYRASRTVVPVEVEDRAPMIDLVEPETFGVINASTDHELEVTFKTPGAHDVDASTAEVRIDDGAWRSVDQVGTFTYSTSIDLGRGGLDFHDGFHSLTVRVADGAGHSSQTNTSFSVDFEDPTLQFSVLPRVVVGDSLTLNWSASEPVGTRVVLKDALDSTTVDTVQSDAFAENGTLVLEGIPSGVYTYDVDAVDAAANREANVDAQTPRTVVVVN